MGASDHVPGRSYSTSTITSTLFEITSGLLVDLASASMVEGSARSASSEYVFGIFVVVFL